MRTTQQENRLVSLADDMKMSGAMIVRVDREPKAANL
jgi:hypothetical protein